MRIIILVYSILVYSFSFFSQDAVYLEFNNKREPVFYKGITNVLYVKQGIPYCNDGSLEIKSLGRKKYAVLVNDRAVDSCRLIIKENKDILENKENEVIKTALISIQTTNDTVQICIGENTTTIKNIMEEELGLCFDIKNELKIISYNIVINKVLIEVIGSRFNDKVKQAIFDSAKNQEIQIEATYKDVLNNRKTINSVFYKE